MKWGVTNLEALSVFGPQYGANARAVPASGTRPRYIRITDIDSDGRLVPGSNVEADIEDGSEFLLQEGDLLFARSGNTVGKTYRYASKDGPCIFAGYLIRFTINPKLADSQFVFYFTQSPGYRSWVMSKRRVAGQPNINGKEYESLRLPVPPISEQRRIAEILDQADTLRKKRAEADIKAARILPALFYKMFGDPAMNPKKWPIANLEAVAEIGTQLVDPNQPQFLDLPHIGGEQIEKETGRILSPKLVRDSDLRSDKFQFTSDHILYSKIRPYLNKVAFPRFEGLCSADIYPIRVRDGRLSPWYLVALLRSPAFLAYTKLHSERLRMAKLNREQLGAFSTPLPDSSVLEVFERQAEQIQRLEKARFEQADRISALFNVLLHRAFSGDLTARWRDAHMKELLAEMQAQAHMIRETNEIQCGERQ
jgi:type I restriction enzyme S subunit